MKYIIIILGLLILGCEAVTTPVEIIDNPPQVLEKRSYNPQTISLEITITVEKQYRFIKKVNRLCKRFSYGNNTIEIYPTSRGFDLAFTTTHFRQFWKKLAKLCERYAVEDFSIEQRTTH